MRKASIDILSKENKSLLEEIGIDYYVLHNSKANELAFASNNHRNREFEIKYMSDGSYRVTTRFLGYKRIMEQYIGMGEKINDPDGRRYGFKVFVYDKVKLNDLINMMLKKGYDPDPKIELI